GQPFDAYLLYYMGLVDLAQGNANSARTALEASLAGVKAANDELAQAVVPGALGLLAARMDDHAEARRRFTEALPLMPRGDDPWDRALSLVNAGLEDARAGLATGKALLVQALRVWRDVGRVAGVALSLAGLGELAAVDRDGRRAGQLIGASQALLPASDTLLAMITPFDLPTCIARARAPVDPGAFRSGPSEGAAWPRDPAVAEGLAQVDE